jgi:MINDY deubiquitinase
LLQNENGPCPLLAAANCLLLQDRVSLPATAIRNNVASLSDLTNILANFALSQHENSNSNNNDAVMMKDDSEKEMMRAQSHYQLNELLQLIPKLQDGMDVNPKFTAGITGYEYTSQLTCFDLWKVQLVHGWLLEQNYDNIHDSTNPQHHQNSHNDDNDFYEAIRDKTYNELVEMVIRGHDARDKVQEIQAQLNELQQQQAKAPSALPTSSAAAFAPPDLLLSSGDGGVVATPTESAVPLARQTSAPVAPPDLLSGEVDNDITTSTPKLMNTTAAVAASSLQDQEHQENEQKQRSIIIQELNNKLDIYNSAANMSARVDDFLQATSHQLTQYGLQALHADLRPNQVVVFFRNNHFSTLTKNEMDGHLYLLVTDLGYCNTPLVVWEELDDIFGNTEYVNSDFCKPEGGAAATTTESGIATSLSPEQLLAQSSQNDADYHLALHLSKQQQQPGSSGSTPALDAQEGQLLAAATEASLREYHGLNSNVLTPTTAMIPPDLLGRVEVGIPISPPVPFTSGGGGGTIVALPPPAAPASGNSNSQLTTAAMTQESADMLLAMQLAASEEGGTSNQSSLHYSNNDTDASYHLARQLQEEENQQAAARRQAQVAQRQRQQQAAATSATMANNRNRAAAATTSSSSPSNANCTIS